MQVRCGMLCYSWEKHIWLFQLLIPTYEHAESKEAFHILSNSIYLKKKKSVFVFYKDQK